MEMRNAESIARFRTDFCQECSDEELVDRANDGQWTAFEQLVRRYQDQFFRLACGYVSNEADAYDVVQLSFLKMHRKLHTFRGEARFKSWAYRIVVNSALSRLRKQKRRGEVALANVHPSVEDDEEPVVTLANWRMRADEVAENRELRQQIAEAVAELEPKYKSVFLLFEVEGFTLAEISELIDLSVPGVKSRLHRARLHLRVTLERYLGELE